MDLALWQLKEGDTWSPAWIVCRVRCWHLVTLAAKLREHGIGLHLIEQGIDTAAAEGRAMFGLLSVAG